MTEEEAASILTDTASGQSARTIQTIQTALQALSQQLEEDHRRYPRLLETEQE